MVEGIMRFCAWVLLAGIVAGAQPAMGQTVDMKDGRVAMTQLAGPWRFHAGDDAAWARPEFDDSGWSLLMAGTSWQEQGYRGYTGVGWYRLRVMIPRQAGPLALYLSSVAVSCEVFANGRLIGHIGELPPRPRYFLERHRLFAIPEDAIQPGQPLEVALRVWLPPIYGGIDAGGPAVPRIGDASVLADWQQLQVHDNFWRQAAAVSDAWIDALTALAGIGLFLLRRREREYLWWGVSQGFWAAFVGISLWGKFFPVPFLGDVVASIAVMAIAYCLQYVFYVILLRQRWGALFWGATISVFVQAAVQLWFYQAPVKNSIAGPVSELIGTIAQVLVVGILWIGLRRGDRDVPYLLIPNCVMLAAKVLVTLSTWPNLYAEPWAGWMRHLLNQTITWPYTIGAFQIIGDFEMLAVLVILVRRYARSRQDEERLESELEAARAVQKVLIPDEVPSVPGFSVETAYRPASQVGGDFFQIIPLAAGGALVAIGDVSGKGMPAAMTVSLLVGTLRTLVYYTQSPGEILSAMNRRMLARSQGGFTTCLVLRLGADGTVTAANAGHIAPYLNGSEMEVANGLPLGLAEAAEYAETQMHMDHDARLTLLTDGVVEARNARGELLGFERTRELSTRPAQDVAKAAQSFGQEDDITVLTLSMATERVAA
jgi:stage II sporulation SpoE-like protein